MRRRRVRRVAAGVLLAVRALNVVFALFWPVQGTRPVDHWLPFGIHPLTVTEAVVGGLALLGLARGLRRGLRPVWIATLVVFLVHHRRPARPGPAVRRDRPCALVFSLWLLVEHQHFRVRPTGVSRLFIWRGRRRAGGHRRRRRRGQPSRQRHQHQFDVVFLLVVVAVLACCCPSWSGPDGSRAAPVRARQEAFDRARAIIETTAATRSTTSPSATTSPGSSPVSRWWPTR